MKRHFAIFLLSALFLALLPFSMSPIPFGAAHAKDGNKGKGKGRGKELSKDKGKPDIIDIVDVDEEKDDAGDKGKKPDKKLKHKPHSVHHADDNDDGEDDVVDDDGEDDVDGEDAGKGGPPHGVRPPGWDKGEKTGWRGRDLPPGLAKKDLEGLHKKAKDKGLSDEEADEVVAEILKEKDPKTAIETVKEEIEKREEVTKKEIIRGIRDWVAEKIKESGEE